MLIPKRLKDMFVNVEGKLNQTQVPIEIAGFYDTQCSFIPGYSTIEFEIDTNDYDTWLCCKKWMTHRECINIGPFKSLCINSLNQAYLSGMFRCNAVFVAKEFDPNNSNWHDWFIQDDTEYEAVI